jgi:hypothetical protein
VRTGTEPVDDPAGGLLDEAPDVRGPWAEDLDLADFGEPEPPLVSVR